MRKLIAVLLVAGLVLATCLPASAMLNRFTNKQQITLWTVVNTSDTLQATNVAPSSKVTAGRSRVLGYTITANSNGYEGYATIYDNSTLAEALAASSMALESEAEMSTTDGSITVFFPYPYLITAGLVLYQGPNTTVTVYLEDTYGPM